MGNFSPGCYNYMVTIIGEYIVNTIASYRARGKTPHRWQRLGRVFGRSYRWFAREYYIYPPSITLLHWGQGLPGAGGRRRGRTSQQSGMMGPSDRRYGDYQMRVK